MKFLIPFLIIYSGTASAGNTNPPYVSCRNDAVKYQLRSHELQQIVAADQADRANNVMRPGTPERDRERRERVGGIFGEGCFKEAKDFSAAALVFQHGDQPEHFMQTFIWAKRAVELGETSKTELMAMAIDRYLVNIGQKQLFGTQYFKPSADPRDAGACWCLEKTEASFPDRLRLKYTGRTYQKRLDSLKDLNGGLTCPVAECARSLAPTPAGSIPGFW